MVSHEMLNRTLMYIAILALVATIPALYILFIKIPREAGIPFWRILIPISREAKKMYMAYGEYVKRRLNLKAIFIISMLIGIPIIILLIFLIEKYMM